MGAAVSEEGGVMEVSDESGGTDHVASWRDPAVYSSGLHTDPARHHRILQTAQHTWVLWQWITAGGSPAGCCVSGEPWGRSPGQSHCLLL